jgi:hypothetical protein
MARIKFGNQYDDTTFNLDVRTSGASSTDIEVGDQRDRAKRDVRIVDLPPGIDLKSLAKELSVMMSSVDHIDLRQNADAVANLRQAERAAHSGDKAGVVAFLQKAGVWALETAKSVGADVATSAIKAALGLS